MGFRLLHYSDLEGGFDRPERIGRLAGLIEARRDDRTLVVDTGDAIAPGVLSLATEGRHALDFFEHVRPDLSTFGNHEFDYGTDALRAIVGDSPQTWVSSNVIDGGAAFGADRGVVRRAVRSIGGHRVGFVGLTDPSTPASNPAAAGLQVADPVGAAAGAARALRENGADAVVALAHCRAVDAIARADGVDLVLAGHVHRERTDVVGDVPVVRPGAGGSVAFELTYDGAEWALTRHDVADFRAVASVRDALADRSAAAGLDDVVASVDEPIARDRARLMAGQTRIGGLVAEAYRWATGADVGLQNSGGVREGPPLVDEVTAADLVGVVPFAEPVSVAELDGRRLVQVVAEADGGVLDHGDPGWWHAQLSGAAAERGPDGALRGVSVGGRPVEPGLRYRLATSDYLFEATHEFPSLGPADRTARTDRPQYAVLCDFAREVGLGGGRAGRSGERGLA